MSRPRSPLWTPSSMGPQISRRNVLRAAALGGTLAAIPGLAACGGGSGSGGGSGTGTSIGSNYSDAVPRKGLQASIDAFSKAKSVDVSVNTVDHEQFQENINAYLQGAPQDVYAWFAGYRMRFFANQGFAGDVSDVWSDSVESQSTDALKQASTADDGKQYLVPFFYYPWGIFYRKSVFADKGYQPPENKDDFVALCEEMKSDGMSPIGFADKEGWPAMGTFDALNFRLNGYDFHINLMAGEESWESDEVKSVFETWRELLPYHQTDSLGRDWNDTATDLENKKVGMYYLGLFVGTGMSPDVVKDDLDFFVFPSLSDEHGTDTIDAPIDGFMMSPEPEDETAAKELLAWLGSAEGQGAYLELDPNWIAASTDYDTSKYTPLQEKAAKIVSETANVAQYLDRDTRPDFASTVMIPQLQTFIKNPDDIDGLCADIEEQKKSIFAA